MFLYWIVVEYKTSISALYLVTVIKKGFHYDYPLIKLNFHSMYSVKRELYYESKANKDMQLYYFQLHCFFKPPKETFSQILPVLDSKASKVWL